jgi:NAD(P)-dependent dehydrogenase (short-subunit alcohol dehydrogenase family)
LVQDGAHIAVLDLSDIPAALLSSSSNEIKFWKTDVSKLEEIERGVEAAASWAAEAGKPLGGVICCAGVGVAAKVCSFV